MAKTFGRSSVPSEVREWKKGDVRSVVCLHLVCPNCRQSVGLTEGPREGRAKGPYHAKRTDIGQEVWRAPRRASPRLHNRILAFWTHRRTLQLASERARGTHTASLKAIYVEKANHLMSDNVLRLTIPKQRAILLRLQRDDRCFLELRDAVRRRMHGRRRE